MTNYPSLSRTEGIPGTLKLGQFVLSVPSGEELLIPRSGQY